MNKVILILIGLVVMCLDLPAQKMQQPLEEIPMSNRGYALLKSGEVIEGKIITSSSSRGITNVSLEDSRGEKHKISANEMQEFAIAMNGVVRLQYLNEKGSSVKKLLSKDQPSAVPNDFIIFRNTSINGNKEILLQLLNPDFDEIFEVFFDPFARKTTSFGGEHITWTGDKHRAYFVSKNDGELIKVKKGNYRKSFQHLFGNCPQIMEVKKPKLKDLENHILLYQNNCIFN